MCSGGGPVITMETSSFEGYSCSSCGKKFKAMGEKPTYPSCLSEDITKLSDWMQSTMKEYLAAKLSPSFLK